MTEPAIPAEKVNRVRILQAEIEQLQMNLNAIEQQSALISRAISSLTDAIVTQNELKNKMPGDEILIPIGGSNHILCTVKDPQKTYVSLGSGITLETDLKSSEERNKTQVESLEGSLKQLQTQYSTFAQHIDGRRQELLEIAQKYQILE